jgi:hypothetical protein
MTPEAQRIAIAKACGWKEPDHPEVMKFKVGWSMPEKWWMCPQGVLRFKHDMPDYLNDLNAAREAVLSLPKGQRKSYVNELQDIVQRDNDDALVQPDLDFYWCNASAKQMSEAFLRTLNLWTDEQ